MGQAPMQRKTAYYHVRIRKITKGAAYICFPMDRKCTLPLFRVWPYADNSRIEAGVAITDVSPINA